jgi:two-component system response regulator DesR
MTSVMIIHEIDLLRGAFAALIANEPDLEVAAQVSPADDVLAVAHATRPDVVVVHLNRCDAEDLVTPRRIREELRDCEILIVCAGHTPEALRRVVDAGIRGFMSADATAPDLVEAVRRLADGERVIDPVLLMTALRDGLNPLTTRQRDVLRLAAEGLGSQEIGLRLYLSAGTVRNYLSAAIRQAGARSLLEAVERAREEGWL